jgi:hypothetical protein
MAGPAWPNTAVVSPNTAAPDGIQMVTCSGGIQKIAAPAEM